MEYYKMILADEERKINREIEMQEISSKYGFSPKIINSKITFNKEDSKYIGNITMEHIKEMCIADKYGEDPQNIPKIIWDQIRTILKILYNEEGIEYIDITGYNFIDVLVKENLTPDFITIDIAHGHCVKMKKMVKYILLILVMQYIQKKIKK